MESQTLRITVAALLAPHVPYEAALVLGLALTACALYHEFFTKE